MKKLVAIALLSLTVSGPALAVTATVSVPGNATGYFGNPVNGPADMVFALRVTGPGTVTIAYKSGSVSDAGFRTVSPTGVNYTINDGGQLPLMEAAGIKTTLSRNFDALIGAFVPNSIQTNANFMPRDATKGSVVLGIKPTDLFFVGRYTSFEASGPGVIYLGINDCNGTSNSGSFMVTVTGP